MGERKEEGETGERNINLFPLDHALTRDEIFSLVMCPEIEPTTFWCVHEIMLQQTEAPLQSPGLLGCPMRTCSQRVLVCCMQNKTFL